MRRSRFHHVFTALVLALTSVACGDGTTGPGSSPPSEPDPNQAPSASIELPDDSSAFVSDQAVLFEGDASDPEDGSLTGTDLTWSSSVDGEIGSGAMLVAGELSKATHTIRLTATDSEGAADSATVPIKLLDKQKVVEALIVGGGPFQERDELKGCPWGDRDPDTDLQVRWAAFPRGTELTVQLSNALSDAQEQAVRDAVQRIGPITGGAVTVGAITTTDSVVPDASRSEIAVGAPEDPTQFDCAENQDEGCVNVKFSEPGVIEGARSLVPPEQTPAAHVHDALGHGALGLCHIDNQPLLTESNSLMTQSPNTFSGEIAVVPTSLDSAAVRTLYESDLEPGATVEDIKAAGLIK